MLQTSTPTTGQKSISLVLSYAPLGLVSAIHSEIGPDSILVDTGCIVLSDKSEVGIVLTIREGERHCVHRIRARVAGATGNGFRLVFEECEGCTRDALLPYITTLH